MNVLLILFAFLFAPADKTPQEAYIEKYAEMAIAEMHRSGVPASITLAQGLLESSYGKSYLTVQANNHFGIKCHDWKGPSVYYDDDEKGECFRKYSSAADSFSDHSDFLRYRDRYKFLFDLDPTDYKAWANGLKKAGYATDPAYPSKLINLIETYHLFRFDLGDESVLEETEPSQEQNVSPSKPSAPVKESPAKKTRKKKNRTKATFEIPQSPRKMETPVAYDGHSGTFAFSTTRPIYQTNGVPFIYSIEGESYSSIARHYDLFLKEILAFNDISYDAPLAPGTPVYIHAKKKGTSRGLDKHIVEEEGEILRDIAQRYGVKIKSLEKLNGITANHVLRPGDTIKLRK